MTIATKKNLIIVRERRIHFPEKLRFYAKWDFV